MFAARNQTFGHSRRSLRRALSRPMSPQEVVDVIHERFAIGRDWTKTVAKALVLLVAVLGPARAQTGRITGIVTDSAAGFPVAGVNVSVIGTSISALTGDNGRYTIANVPAGTHILEARRLGYSPLRRAGVAV